MCAARPYVVLFGSIAVFTCTTGIGYADPLRPFVVQDGKIDIPQATLSIKNAHSSKLTFELSHNNKNWTKFALAKGKGNLFANTKYIRVKTPRPDKKPIEVRYSLKNSKRYHLRWNKVRLCWDVFETQGPS